MKKRVNPLLTSLLAGTMLLGSVSVAAAATTNCSTSTYPVSTQQQVTAPNRPDMNTYLNHPIAFAINYDQLSAILDNLVADATITSDQADAILSNLTTNGSVTRAQLYELLTSLVADGTISKAEMTVIMNNLPTQNQAQLLDNGKKGQPAPVAPTPQQPTNTNQLPTK